ncbi:MAG TPA: glycosyl hydrolase, partial [Gemmataceae bacterium]
RFIDFLSPKWMAMLAHTTAEAKRLGLGMDLTTGTGWPFGGPTVTADDASSRAALKRYAVAGGKALAERLPDGKLRALVAVSGGEQIDLTDRVKDGKLDWTAPPGDWKLCAVAQQGPVMKVKRAAPGGAGNVLDPFSPAKLGRYLAVFDKAFADFRAPLPRAHFHDSYEYYNASWTDDLFAEFRNRRGYDLKQHLPALFGDGPADAVARVKCDYRETLSDLHRAYLERWTAWCHGHGGLSRNQAHGGPGNILDAYAAADIPECEIYSRYAEEHRPFLKMASSAAHLTGRTLASSESFTWLGEHFRVPLSKVKPAADYLFLAGVNHIFFHGIPYSPKDAPWPGWQFYAAVNFGPGGGLWHDLPAFNAYVTRCQSVLQSGRPANDVLLYVPFHDFWQTPDGLVKTFAMPGTWMEPFPVHAAAMTLEARGYGYDEASDRLLASAAVDGGAVRLGGNPYRAVVVPKCRVIPAATVRKLIDLARGGAMVIFLGSLPADVPGFGDLERRRAELRAALRGVTPPAATVGAGRVFVGDDVDALLRSAGVVREPMADAGLRFVRRTHPGGHHYFLVNRGDKAVDGWVSLGTPARSAVLLDPLAADRAGVAAFRRAPGGAAEVYLQLDPGESRVLRTFAAAEVSGKAWPYGKPAGEPVAVVGPWAVEFVEGGPELPARYETQALASWTTRPDPEAKRFAGTARYTADFDRPPGGAADWVLDLGDVRESARVAINGTPIGTLFCRPFRVPVGRLLKPGRNTLTVEVTNLAANRVADLDRRKVNWKYFYDANLANHPASGKRGVLDASAWPPADSGLLGPVRLVPVGAFDPRKPG